MDANNFFNDLFNKPLKKEEPKKDNKLKTLSIVLDRLNQLISPFQKAIGQGVRQNHKYIKRTGAPGNYQYWYKNPQSGQIYSADKPQNPAHAGLNADQKHNFYDKPKIVVVQAKKGPIKNWSTSSKVNNTINHSQYGSITLKENPNDTFSAVHNGRPIKNKFGQSQFATKEDMNAAVNEHIGTLGKPSDTKQKDRMNKIRSENTVRAANESKTAFSKILGSGNYSLISAGKNPKLEPNISDSEIKQRYDNLEKELRSRGYKYTRVEGNYDGKEDSFIVYNANPKDIENLGTKFNQDSVINSAGGNHKMIYTSGANKGQYHSGSGHEEKQNADNYYTNIKHEDGSNTKFSLNFDFDKLSK